MRWALGALLLTTACYAPKVLGGEPCDLADPNSCPMGQRCEMRSDGAFCTGGTSPDGGANDDAPPGSFCIGANLIGKQCTPSAPTATFAVTGTMLVNTSSTNVGNCTEIRGQTGGPSLCVIIAGAITIPVGTTLRATGPNPLVLFASTITVAGTLDVASHVSPTDDTRDADLGAGARGRADCPVTVDGGASDGKNNGVNAGGGAAGGSFGTAGGEGGPGRGNIAGGKPVAGTAQTVLIGGCPGGLGGKGTDGGGEGRAGGGGGAVYLLAKDSITVTGVINASGSGGNGGRDGLGSSGGGGGGGSGGMIGLEAAKIMATGSLFANGGAGGGGGGDSQVRHGGPGADPSSALAAATGGTGGQGGGGAGANGATLALTGLTGKGAGNNDNCGGGGGGGGVGVIHIYGDPAPTLGTISPPRS